MGTPTAAPQSSDDQAVRDIPKWTARYVYSRTLVIIPGMLLFVAAWAVIAGISWLSGQAYRNGSPLSPLYAVAAVVACVVWVWAVVTGRLNALAAYSRRIYAAEGEAVPAALPAASRRGPRTAGILFGSAILLTVLSGFIFNWPLRLMQPISAVYSVPFLVYLCYKQGHFAAPLMLLWPALYAIHAALILAGVPLGFLESPSVSILFPVAVYGIIAALASHIYGRFALRKLRRLAQADDTQAMGGQPQ
jgi:hypothetical protein